MKAVSPHASFARRSTVAAWSKALAPLRDAFVTAVSKDTGRSEAESYLYDWMPVEASLQFLKDNIEIFAEPYPISSGLPMVLGNRTLFERRVPLGHVLIVGTWNFPLSLHLSQILFALASGNKVTFKASPFTPEVARVFAQELPKVFGEDRYFTWTGGDADCVSAVEKGRFQGLIFTGGSTVAKIYGRAAAESFTKCVLEASGSESALVHSSALSGAKTEALVDHLLWALLHFNGQTCVAPRYWFVPAKELDDVWSRLKKLLDSPAASESFATRAKLRHDGVVQEFGKWVEWAKNLPGAELHKARADQPATFIKVPSAKSLPVDSPSSFGPGAVIVGYDDFKDAVEWTRQSPWSLMTQVYGSPSQDEWDALQTLETSIVSVGESIVAVGDPAVTFGGKGLSGSGSTHGLEGLRELTRAQVILEAKSWPGTQKMMRPAFSTVNELNKRVPLLKSLRKWF
jgi:aldehyde dehydrogenase (NAD+)